MTVLARGQTRADPVAPEPPPRGGRLFPSLRRPPEALAGHAFGALLALRMVADSFGSRLIAGDDATAIVARTDRTIGDVFAAGRLNGWSPYFSTGHDAFLVNPPGFTLLVAALRGLSGGQLSTAGAIKMLVVMSFVLLPSSVAAVARSFGMDRRAATYAGLMALCVSVFAGMGLIGTFATGLYPFQVAVPVSFATLAAFARLAEAPCRRRMVVAGALLAALVLLHVVLTAVLLICLGAVLSVQWVAGRWQFTLTAAASIAGAGITAFALAAWWALPLLVHRDLVGAAVTWQPPTFNEQVVDTLSGKQVVVRPVALFLLAGWAVAFARALRGHRRELHYASAALLALLAAQLVSTYFAADGLAHQLPWRSAGMIAVVALLPACSYLAAVVGWLGRRRMLANRVLAVECIGLLICGWLVTATLTRLDVDQELPRPIDDMYAMASEMQRVVPPVERIAIQEDFPHDRERLGVATPQRWLAWRSGRDVLNVFNPELSKGAIAGSKAVESIGKASPAQISERLREYGTGWLVTTTANERRRLDVGLFERVADAGDLTLFKLRPDSRRPDAGSLVSFASIEGAASYRRASNEEHSFVLSVPEKTTARLAIAYSPRWQLTIDDRRAPVRATEEGVIEFEVEAGERRAELRYERDPWTLVGALISVVVVVFIVGAARRRSGGRCGSVSEAG